MVVFLLLVLDRCVKVLPAIVKNGGVHQIAALQASADWNLKIPGALIRGNAETQYY